MLYLAEMKKRSSGEREWEEVGRYLTKKEAAQALGAQSPWAAGRIRPVRAER